MGDSVRAITAETVTEAARVNANSTNSAPVSPPWKPMGTKTASSTTVMATMGPASSRAARLAAATAGTPPSRWRLTFSTTMMASSTTRPMASTRASRVSRFTEKPSASMIANVPMSDSGIATIGMTTERGEPRNMKMTSITITSASMSVVATSWIELFTNTVES